MKIYLASSWKNERFSQVLRELRDAGHEVYNFRDPVPDSGFHWSDIDREYHSWTATQFVAALEHPRAQQGFRSNMAAMKAADVCVLLLPCGRSSHLEAGWFVGQEKPVFILLDEAPTAELMYGMTTARCLDTRELLAKLGKED